MYQLTLKTLVTIFFFGTTSYSFFTGEKFGEPKGDKERPRKENILTKKEKREGRNLLFDGKTLKGWHGYNIDRVPDSWVVKDGMIKITTEGGKEGQDIITNKVYRNFEDWQICGANYGMYPPKVKPYRPIGEWNSAKLVVDGNKVTQYLNGKMTVEYVKYSDEWKKLRNSGKWADYPDYGKFDEGHISFQNHGANVFYKNVKIKEL